MCWAFKTKSLFDYHCTSRQLVMVFCLMFSVFSRAEVNDPTRPIFLAPEPEAVVEEMTVAMQLQSIYYGANKKLAIINDSVVGEGDYLENWKIKRIEHQSVVLVRKGQQKRIALVPRIVTPTK